MAVLGSAKELGDFQAESLTAWQLSGRAQSGPYWAGREGHGQSQPLGFAIDFGFAMPTSAAQEDLASSRRRYHHPLRALKFFPGCTAPLLTCASAKSPGSTWPIHKQRAYAQFPVQATNEKEGLTACVPPRERGLYHPPQSSALGQPHNFKVERHYARKRG